jgi:hypothetical protein
MFLAGQELLHLPVFPLMRVFSIRPELLLRDFLQNPVLVLAVWFPEPELARC